MCEGLARVSRSNRDNRHTYLFVRARMIIPDGGVFDQDLKNADTRQQDLRSDEAASR